MASSPRSRQHQGEIRLDHHQRFSFCGDEDIELPLSTAQQQRQLPRLSRLPTSPQLPLSSLHCEDEENQPPECKPISGPFNPLASNMDGDADEEDIPLAPMLDKSVTGGLETPLGSLVEEHAVFADLVSIKSTLSTAEVRYRKYQRRKPLRKVALQLEDVIIEENEEELAAASSDDYASLTNPATASWSGGAEAHSSSDDELGLGKYSVVDTSFADEILSELYGTTSTNDATAATCEESSSSETVSAAAQSDWRRDTSMSPRSLADEILEELYGEVGGGCGAEDDYGVGGGLEVPGANPPSPGRKNNLILSYIFSYSLN